MLLFIVTFNKWLFKSHIFAIFIEPFERFDEMIWISIERNSSTPLAKQVYNKIKEQILEGRLPAGEKLPSTRSLSKSLAISRNGVMEAYEQLFAEGYTECKQGSGTRVAEGIGVLRRQQLDLRKGELNQIEKSNDNFIDFRSGVPALDMFPKKEWGKLFYTTCIEAASTFFGYSDPEGRWELRKEVADYLFRVRGIDCSLEQILITTGSTQSLALVARLLYSPGAEIAVEDPVNCGLFKVLSAPGYNINPIPVDGNGIKTELLVSDRKVSFTCITPSHQFPLGGILNIKRRIELVNYARNTESYIIEDDYDSEFRYEGHPVSSLYELAPDRVIYIGSFSKILAPALRLGYIILPHILLSGFKYLKKYSDVHTASLEQIALASFIKEGKLDKHISRCKKVYMEKQKVLIKELDKRFAKRHIVSGQSTGLHIVAEFQETEFNKSVLDVIKNEGVKVYPVESHAILKGNHKNKIIMGYGHLNIDKIEDGVKRLERALSRS